MGKMRNTRKVDVIMYDDGSRWMVALNLPEVLKNPVTLSPHDAGNAGLGLFGNLDAAGFEGPGREAAELVVTHVADDLLMAVGMQLVHMSRLAEITQRMKDNGAFAPVQRLQ